MATGRPKPSLALTDEERIQLRSLAGSRTLPHALVARAKLVLWSSEGETNTRIARRLRWAKATVGKWRQRFVRHRLAGLYDELRPGRPRSIEDQQIAALLKRTLSRKPAAGTHWTVRQAAQASGSPSRPCTGCSKPSRCNRIGHAASNSLLTRSSSRRCGTSSVCT
jgi:putative transposase